MAAADFERELNAFGVEIEAQAVARKREAMLELFGQLVKGTPVGNPRLWKRKAPKGYVGGYHRGQWQLTSGDAADGEVPLRSADEAIAAAEAAAGDVDLERTGWITNSGPAINRLEFDGHSKQARSGWVRAAIERIRARYS